MAKKKKGRKQAAAPKPAPASAGGNRVLAAGLLVLLALMVGVVLGVLESVKAALH